MSSTSFELNPQNKIIRAGAGAGKTTTLVKEFIDFVLKFEKENGKFPRIVVTTFTRKATQELKERLLARAYDLQREDLLDYLSNKNRVHISTIHGVLYSFLSQYGYHISFSGDLAVKSEADLKFEKQYLLKKLINKNEQFFTLFEDYEWSQILKFLSEYFKGSLCFSDFKPISSQELAQMAQQKWNAVLSKQKEICQSILNQTQNEKWMDYISHWNLFLENCESNPKDILLLVEDLFQSSTKPAYLKKNPPFEYELHEQFDDIRSEIKKMAESRIYDPMIWSMHQEKVQVLDELGTLFASSYYEQKINTLQLSMDDLEGFAYHLVQKAPESARAFAKEWDYWMIDEYQDTSPLQEKLLNLFIAHSPAFYVGDPQQSIYLFRGARSELFFKKINEIKNYKGENLEMMINYRSHSSVLNFINEYFTKLNSQFSAMIPHHNDVISNLKPKEQPIQLMISEAGEDPQNQEVDVVIYRIQELIAQGVRAEQICVLSRTNQLLDQISERAKVFSIEIQQHGSQEYNSRRETLDFIAIIKFILNPHDNLNLLILLRSPWFNVSDQGLYEICKREDEPPKEFTQYKSFWMNYLNRKSHLKISDLDKKSLSFLESYYNAAKSQPLTNLLKQILKETGFLDYCYQLDPSGQREANLWKMVSLLSEQMKQPGFQILKFIETLDRSLSDDGQSMMNEAVPVIEPQKVNLMTIHASKGLQFDYVIIPGMGKAGQRSRSDFFMLDEESSKWTILVKDEDSQESIKSPLAEKILKETQEKEKLENQRVLYVAMTRAKKGISLTWSSDFSKNSWVEEMPLDLSEGLHESNFCRYFVRKEVFVPLDSLSNKENRRLNLVRPLYEHVSQTPKNKKISVTEKIRKEKNQSIVPKESSELEEFENSKIYFDQLVQSYSKVNYGIYLHKKLEQLKYLTPEKIELIKNSHNQENGLNYILSLQEPPMLELIRQGEVEWGFSTLMDGERVEGQIDLWSYLAGTLYVVDYKTGSPRYLENAFTQLNYYQRAICQIKNLKPQKIQLVVIFTEVKQVYNREASQKL